MGDEATNEKTDDRAATQPVRRIWSERRRLRSWVAAVLVVLASLSVAIATVSVWTHDTLFDTDQFMEVVDDAVNDPAFAAGISARVTDEVLVALDLEARVSDALERLDAYVAAALIDVVDPGERLQAVLDRIDRPSLSVLAPAIAENLETRISARIDGLITSDTFRSRLDDIVREAHRATVALLRSDFAAYPNVYVQDGEVRLDLVGVVVGVLQAVWTDVAEYLPDVTLPEAVSDRGDEARAELAETLGTELPDDFAQVTIVSEDALSEIQGIADRADRFVVLIVVLAALLVAATIVVSPNRRRTLIQLSFGAIAALILAFVAIRGVEDAVVAAISSPNGVRTAETLLADLTADLRGFAMVVLSVAVVVGIAAFAAGRPALMARFSGREEQAPPSTTDRWVAEHQGVVRAAGLVGVLVGLAIVGLSWWSVLIAALLLGGVLLYVGSVESQRER